MFPRCLVGRFRSTQDYDARRLVTLQGKVEQPSRLADWPGWIQGRDRSATDITLIWLFGALLDADFGTTLLVRRWRLSDAWKLFLPSWNFFADFDTFPRMEAALLDAAGCPGQSWLDLFPPRTASGLGRVLFNPTGNLDLLEQSQVERAVIALDELREAGSADPDAEFFNRAEYATLVGIARRRLRFRTAEGGPSCDAGSASSWVFQFRLRIPRPPADSALIFVSHRHALGTD